MRLRAKAVFYFIAGVFAGVLALHALAMLGTGAGVWPFGDRAVAQPWFAGTIGGIDIAGQLPGLLPNLLAIVVLAALLVALEPVNLGLAMVAVMFGVLSRAVALAIPSAGQGILDLRNGNRGLLPGVRTGEGQLAGASDAAMAGGHATATSAILWALAILLLSVVMTRGAFGLGLAWVGIATGCLGILEAVTGAGHELVHFGCGALSSAWLAGVAVALIHLAARLQPIETADGLPQSG